MLRIVIWTIFFTYAGSLIVVKRLKLEGGSVVKFFSVFDVSGEFAEGGHGLVDIAVHHRPGHAQVFGDELRRLVLELHTLEDLELAQRDVVTEILDQGGQQRAVEGVGFTQGFLRGIGRGQSRFGC